MEILLTGATGFLGSHLAKALMAESHSITCITRQSSSLDRLEQLIGLPNFRVVAIDSQRVRETFDQLLSERKFDSVVHVATEYGRGSTQEVGRVLESNIVMPVQLLNAAIDNSVPLFVNTDSYFNKPLLNYLALPDYSLSKRSFLEWLKVSANKIAVVNMRLEHVYGPADNDNKFVPFVIDQLAIKKPKRLALTEGTQKRDFIYVTDVVNAFLSLLHAFDTITAEGFSEFEIGTGTSTPVSEISRLVKELTESQTVLGYGDLFSRENEIEDSFSNRLFSHTFSWQPEIDLRVGLEKIVRSEIGR
jgi:CDP-paratose synthetase